MDVGRAMGEGLDFFGGTVAQVRADQWANPTPCEGWDARALVGHMVGVMGIAGQMIGGGALAGSLAPVTVGDDPAQAWAQAAADVRTGLATADLDTERDTALGRRPLSFSLTFPAFDLYLHAWDLGQATGQPVHIPDDVVGWIDGFLRQLPPDRMRGPQTFGAEQPAPPGADATTRLMAFTSRVVEPSATA